MSKKAHSLGVAIVLAVLATVSIATAPAEAAEVVCKTNGVALGCVAAAAPAAVRHVGYTRVTPYDVRHVGYTRVWR